MINVVIVKSETDTPASKTFDELLDMFALWNEADYNHHCKHHIAVATLFADQLQAVAIRVITPYVFALTAQKLKTDGNVEATAALITIRQRIKSNKLWMADYFPLIKRIKQGLSIIE